MSGIAAAFSNDLVKRFNTALPETHVALQTTAGGVVVVSAVDGGQGQLGLAAAAAGAALVLVATVGVLVHAPLSRVPENTIKFAVGLLLTTFGTFWAAEGAGVSWPGDELALLGLLGFLAALAFFLVELLRRQRLSLQAGEA